MGKNEKPLKVNAGVVVSVPTGAERVVLVEETASHKKGKLSLPKGTRDPEDLSYVDTAIRETREESGLIVAVTGLIGVYRSSNEGVRKMSIIYAADLVSGFMTPSAEHPRVDAFSIEEIDEFYAAGKLRDEAVHRAAHAFVDHEIIPLDMVADRMREPEWV